MSQLLLFHPRQNHSNTGKVSWITCCLEVVIEVILSISRAAEETAPLLFTCLASTALTVLGNRRRRYHC